MGHNIRLEHVKGFNQPNYINQSSTLIKVLTSNTFSNAKTALGRCKIISKGSQGGAVKSTTVEVEPHIGGKTFKGIELAIDGNVFLCPCSDYKSHERINLCLLKKEGNMKKKKDGQCRRRNWKNILRVYQPLLCSHGAKIFLFRALYKTQSKIDLSCQREGEKLLRVPIQSVFNPVFNLNLSLSVKKNLGAHTF